MKTTTIGRIGAIVTGAAMLGTAVASALAGAVAVDSALDEGFFFDASMNPKVQVVVGEKAASSDGAAAGQIAAMIGNMAFGTKTVTGEGKEVTVQGGTATCTPNAAQCAGVTGTAEGSVTLSWDAIGLVGELQQKEMNCNIYEVEMLMTGLTDGGDYGDWCDYLEVYTPEDTVGETLIGICQTTAGADRTILREEEFANEICTICYNFCDIALGCEPHLFQEWVEINCENIDLEYDCEMERLVLTLQDEALKYNVFTDDILTEDILDEDEDLVGQSYLGRIILGGEVYYVEDLTDDQITIVCGETGTATTTTSMEYIPPLEGYSCDAANSNDVYSIRLVGAQTIEEKGVVDVTLEVTKPDGTTEQVTSGISGTPVVGDIKVKLQRGTAASNVITGEQSFSADLLVWYVPSEYIFDDDEDYSDEGIDTDDDDLDLWDLDFNSGNRLTILDIGPKGDDLEEDTELYEGVDMPDGLDENEHWDSCYDEARDKDNDTEIVRNLEFTLRDTEEVTELSVGEMVQFPFYDGRYLLSDLKFGYMGLHTDDFISEDMVDKTEIDIDLDDIEVKADGILAEDLDMMRKVTVDYVDEEGEQQRDVRLDEGPFDPNGDDLVLVCNELVKIKGIVREEGDIYLEMDRRDGDDWDEFREDEDSALMFSDTTYSSALVLSALNSEWVDFSNGFMAEDSDVGGVDDGLDDAWWLIRNFSDDRISEWELWLDKDTLNDGNAYGVDLLDMAETCNGGGTNSNLSEYCGCDDWASVQTEFDNDVWFCARDTFILVAGADNSGMEDYVGVNLIENGEDGDNDEIDPSYLYNNISEVYIGYEDTCTYCALDGDCDDISEIDDSGKLLGLSGAIVDVDRESIEEPEDANDEDIVTGLKLTIPEYEVRPTIFFGNEETSNTSDIVITDSMVNQVVDIGGVDVTVEEFGVVGGFEGGGMTDVEPVTVACDAQTAQCPDVQVEADARNPIGYKLVVVEGQQTQSNLVLMGGPAVNGLTQDLVTTDEVCSAAVIKLVGNKLIVAGCEAADTMAAANDLVNWLKNLM